jgi:hypothetical protein
MLHHGITGACNEDVVELAKAALGTAGARVLDLQNIGTQSASTAPAAGTNVQCATSSTRTPAIGPLINAPQR